MSVLIDHDPGDEDDGVIGQVVRSLHALLDSPADQDCRVVLRPVDPLPEPVAG